MATPLFRMLIPDLRERAIPFVITLFESLGLSIKNPQTGRITTWNEEGSQEEIEESLAFTKLATGPVRNVQFWKTAGDDVFVTWDERSDGCLLSIFLNGVSLDLAAALVGAFTRSALTEFRGRYGETTVLSLLIE